MSRPARSRFADQSLHQQFLTRMDAVRQVSNLGVFHGVNAPPPLRPVDRFNQRAERAAQVAIAAAIGALIAYGYGADAAAALLARV